jgi:protoheme IX farnesyltransferase
MNNYKTHTSLLDQAGFLSKLADLGMLFKFRLTMLVVFSSVMSYFIAAAKISVLEIIMLIIGGSLITFSANTLNQVLEKDYDCLMKRTANRPLPQGRMSVSAAVLLAGFLSLIGISALCFVNMWAGVLGTISLILYAFIYTPLKRISSISVLIGAIPGALPMSIGCVVAEGSLTPLALALFAVQFFWQFPHFWAIAFLSHDDYSNAGYKMMPSKSGLPDAELGYQSFIYSLFLYPVFISMWYIGYVSIVGVLLLTAISIIYSYLSWVLYRKVDIKSAKTLMFSSFAYLPLALFILLIFKNL